TPPRPRPRGAWRQGRNRSGRRSAPRRRRPGSGRCRRRRRTATRAAGPAPRRGSAPPCRSRPARYARFAWRASLAEDADLDLAERDGVAFGLKRDVALLQQQLAVLDELGPVGVPLVELRLLVLHDGLAVDDVPDLAAAVDLDLGRHPLVAVEGLRLRRRAVPGDELVVHDDVRAGGADAAGRPVTLAGAAQELGLDGDGEVLVLADALGRLAVEHDAAVAQRPVGPALALLADEAVLHPHGVVGELLLVEDVPELAVELLVLVVRHLQQPVLDPERVGVVVA